MHPCGLGYNKAVKTSRRPRQSMLFRRVGVKVLAKHPPPWHAVEHLNLMYDASIERKLYIICTLQPANPAGETSQCHDWRGPSRNWGCWVSGSHAQQSLTESGGRWYWQKLPACSTRRESHGQMASNDQQYYSIKMPWRWSCCMFEVVMWCWVCNLQFSCVHSVFCWLDNVL